MNKIQFQQVRISLFPTSAVVVTASDGNRELAAATIAWNGIFSSRPPVIGVSFLPDSFTRKCILETREFVVNVPDGRYWQETNFLGSLSGPLKDKLAKYPASLQKLTFSPSSRIRPPRIDEFYLNFECRTLSVVQIGLYDCFFGEVLTMHCTESVYHERHPKGGVEHTDNTPILCLADEYWSGGTKYLGTSTENKNHPHGREH